MARWKVDETLVEKLERYARERGKEPGRIVELMLKGFFAEPDPVPLEPVQPAAVLN